MNNKNIQLLNREGTYQSERLPEALKDDYVKIDERSLIDLVKQTAEYAAYVKYYNNNNIEDDNWTAFFEEIYDYKEKKVKFSSIEELENKLSTSPHLSLFLAFLRIFKIAQDNLNTLTEKHLNFYYREVLQLKPREAKPDRVPLIFELNKAADQVMLPANTLFNAGNDKNGKPLYYATKNDLIVNKAKVDVVKGIYMKQNGGNFNAYSIDDVINSAKTGELQKDNVFLGIPCHKAAQLGFAIASPLFNLKEGKREITISLGDKRSLLSCFKAEYSSEEGWLEASFDNTNSILRITSGQPPVVPYNESIHSAGFNTIHPVIRFILKDGTPESCYSDLCTFESKNITKIEVSVTEVKDLTLRNDYGLLDHSNSFFPFGTQPKRGDALYIGNKNIFNKYLDSFKINIDWKGLPEKTDSYYAYYPFPFEANLLENFKQNCPPGKVQILNNGTWKADCYSEDKKTGYYLKEVNNVSPDFIKIELDYDLGHSAYPELYSSAVIDKVKNPKISLPKPPYTPEINTFSINYKASDGVDYAEHQLFRIHPFGQMRLNENTPFFPDVDTEGALLIGINNIDKPLILSLYFRLNDYCCSFNKTRENDPVWFYLRNNEWVKFDKSDIILDSTNHFSKSGMIYFSINSDAITPHAILPDNKVWIKLSINKDSDVYPALENIYTQVVDAEFINRENDITHLEKGLPQAAISKAVNTIQGIKSILQPYCSYGGRPVENPKSFYTRISERLRHKDRAWNVWDYERLILEHYPSILKAKCIPYSNNNVGYSPGSIFIILLPDCNIISQIDIYKPIVNKALIDEIHEFFQSYCSPFVDIYINNAEYEEITVDCKVAFTQNCNDESYYRDQLNEDLKTFLSPWTKNDVTIDFRKTMYVSQIIYFIENRPYIDYIENLKVFVNSNEVQNNTILSASKQNAILTSNRTHKINEY